MTWHSLHVHYQSPQDRLLVDCIGPLIAWGRSGPVAGWFFLRYWKHGPHLRLRLQLEDASALATRQAIQTNICEYLVAHPSASVLPPERLAHSLTSLAELEGDDDHTRDLVPDNAVQVQPYEPEHAKYGGAAGVALAERLFEQSSDVAVEVLARTRQAPRRRLGIAFTMMVAGLRAAGLTEGRIAEFLAAYCHFWSRYASDEFATTWPAALARHERTLSAHAAAALSDETPSASPTAESLIRWTSALRTAMQALDTRTEDILRLVTMPGPEATAQRRRGFLLLNYLHTHNNRLFVTPAHEGYLGYLGHHVVCRLAGIAPDDGLAGRMLAAVRQTTASLDFHGRESP